MPTPARRNAILLLALLSLIWSYNWRGGVGCDRRRWGPWC
jgi:hypothetical protein